MAEAEKLHRVINPCLLLLQKMGLELRCPICLNLLRRPISLPCGHISCSPCVPEIGSSCLVCKVPFLCQDLRSVPQMENMVTIYSSMEAAFSAYRVHLSPQVCPADRVDKSAVQQMQNSQSTTLNPVPSSVAPVQEDNRVKAFTLPRKSPIKRESKTLERPPKYCKLGDGTKSQKCVRLCSQNCVHSAKVDALVNEMNPARSPSPLSMDMNHKMDEAHQRDVNQWAAPTSPGSPLSFGDMKDSDDDNNDQGNEHLRAEQMPAKGVNMKEHVDNTNTEAKVILPSSEADHSTSKTEVLGKLNVVGKNDPTSPAKEGHASDLKGQQNSESRLHEMAPRDASKCVKGNLLFACAFCQSSEESEASGPMFHYVNGKALAADQAAQANALHVHRKCIEWAPQVYFVGETVMNLEAELARGLKIKCSSCGKKGAALGCYSKSCRRSFHVPCAYNILDCRWDCENFLMLCPVHSSQKLPCEKNPGKIRTKHSLESQLNYVQTSAGSPSMSEQSKLWDSLSGISSKWVLCGSALSTMEKDLVAEFVSLTGASITKFWKPNVTHVIASTNDMGACSRTLKFLMGILNGTWIVKIDWIKACMEAKHPVDEEPYEIALDVHGCCNGPKCGRIRVQEKAPKLFSGLNFYFSRDFVPSYKGYLTDLVVAAGGNVLLKKDIIHLELKMDTEVTRSATLLIYNADTEQESESVEESSLAGRELQEAENLAAKIGAQIAPHTWLLESIAACKLQHI